MLNPIEIRKLVLNWLEEDAIHGLDYSGLAIGNEDTHSVTCVLLAKENGVLAGCPFFEAVFQELHCTVEWLTSANDVLGEVNRYGDGQNVVVGQRVALVTGNPRYLLLGERTALNCLCRASGITTQAVRIRKTVERGAPSWQGKLAGTRKTTPGFRLVEKYSLIVAGIDPHRYDPSSMVMLKDNHVWAAGSVTKAINNCRKTLSFSLKMEVECRSLQEAREAAQAGCDIVMLDNFAPETAKAVSKTLKEEFPNIIIDASGGINEKNVLQFTYPTIDVISMSQFTQGYPVLDFSLKVLKDGHDPTNPIVTKI